MTEEAVSEGVTEKGMLITYADGLALRQELESMDPQEPYTPWSFDDVELTPLELEVLKRMRSVVEANGTDYIYPDYDQDCKYFEYLDGVQVNHNAPSCLVGHVFAEMGLSEQISTFENEQGITEVIDSVFFEYPPAERTKALVAALLVAQTAQDQGRTWGHALRAFERVLHNRVQIREKGEA